MCTTCRMIRFLGKEIAEDAALTDKQREIGRTLHDRMPDDVAAAEEGVMYECVTAIACIASPEDLVWLTKRVAAELQSCTVQFGTLLLAVTNVQQLLPWGRS